MSFVLVVTASVFVNWTLPNKKPIYWRIELGANSKYGISLICIGIVVGIRNCTKEYQHPNATLQGMHFQ